jgi:hypothetical protein
MVGDKMACFADPQKCDKANKSRLRKWDRMSRNGVCSFMRSHPASFRRRLLRGIPAEHRWTVWKSLLLDITRVNSSRDAEEREKFLFSGPNASSCVAGLLRAETKWSQSIKVDVPRTFSECQAFTEEDRASLCRILNAYAFLNPQVGYCQGMGYVAGVLLLASGGCEHEALFFFVRLMEDCGLRELYSEGFPLMHKYVEDFQFFMDELLPELQQHFNREGVQPEHYLHQWFLTVFACCLPMQTVLLLWDSFMCNGLETVVLAAVALLSSVKEVLLVMQREEIMQFFKRMKLSEEEEGEFAVGRWLVQHLELLIAEPYVQRRLGISAQPPRASSPNNSARRRKTDESSNVLDDLNKNPRRVHFQLPVSLAD